MAETGVTTTSEEVTSKAMEVGPYETTSTLAEDQHPTVYFLLKFRNPYEILKSRSTNL